MAAVLKMTLVILTLCNLSLATKIFKPTKHRMQYWRLDKPFAKKVKFPNPRITLYDQGGCEGPGVPYQYLNCDGSCLPVTGRHRSVLLEAHSGIFHDGTMPADEPLGADYSSVHVNGPEIALYAGPATNEFGCGVQDFIARTFIPWKDSFTCVDFENEWIDRVKFFTVSHMEICPWERKRIKQAYWWKDDPDYNGGEVDWSKMELKDMPEWTRQDIAGDSKAKYPPQGPDDIPPPNVFVPKPEHPPIKPMREGVGRAMDELAAGWHRSEINKTGGLIEPKTWKEAAGKFHMLPQINHGRMPWKYEQRPSNKRH